MQTRMQIRLGWANVAYAENTKLKFCVDLKLVSDNPAHSYYC